MKIILEEKCNSKEIFYFNRQINTSSYQKELLLYAVNNCLFKPIIDYI